MKSVRKLLTKPAVLVASLGALLVAGLSIGVRSELSKSDWGTWVGSIGTVLTLVGTIILATAGERKRRQDELELAVIVAAEFILRIPNMQSRLMTIACDLERTRNGSYGEIYQECFTQIKVANVWDAASLKPLVIVPDHAAARLALAATRINHVAGLLYEGTNLEMLTIGEVRTYEELLVAHLNDAVSRLEEPADACRTFLREQGVGFDLPVG